MSIKSNQKQREKLLRVKNLKTSFHTDAGSIFAVDDISFHIDKGETLAIVGESGCGKSVSSLSILRLIQSPPGQIDENSKIIFEDKNLLDLDESEMREIRGNKISMIFQEPMTSLNPVYTVGNQIAEVFMTHRDMKKKEALKKSVEMLKTVAIPSPEERINSYPHELSGGMRQRVMIAMALACEPSLIIADEPTTALDITIQAQILKLIEDLKDNINTSIILITHNLGIVAQVSDRVIVMYAGSIVEEASVRDIFTKAKHPYTKGLLNSIPILGQRDRELEEIPGSVPKHTELPKVCKFINRCYKKEAVCEKEKPELVPVSENHFVRCILAEK